MAAIYSLGLQEPSALPYLLRESSLPADAQDLYEWQANTTLDDDTLEATDEELLVTQNCVVWSTSAVVKRVYNLDIEGEKIIKAFVTSLQAVPVANRSRNGQLGGDGGRPAGQFLAENGVNACHRRVTDSLETGLSTHGLSSQERVRALVVILRTQVHVFFVSGESHVIPLPVQVGNAWPTATGIIFQRLLSDPASDTSTTFSSRLRSCKTVQDSVVPNRGLGVKQHERASLALATAAGSMWMSPEPRNQDLPRAFSLVEAQGELGLVVVDEPNRRSHAGYSVRDLRVLSPEEDIIYISSRDELSGSGAPDAQPLYLAVTLNEKKNSYTIWEVTFHGRHNHGPLMSPSKPRTNGVDSRRRSSNVLGRATGTATPVGRAQSHVRESFGTMAQSHAENINHKETTDPPASQLEQLAASLGSDFGEVGVQTRAARRVSSMLARSDLSSAPDRMTLNEFAHNTTSRKSLNTNILRGESLGGFSDRQSLGPRPRGFLLGNESVISSSTSFLHPPADSFLDEHEIYDRKSEPSGMSLNDSMTELPNDISLKKIESISRTERKSPLSHMARSADVFLLSSPTAKSEDKLGITISACILDRDAMSLSVIGLFVASGEAGYSSSGRKDAVSKTSSGRVRAKHVQRGFEIIDACKIGRDIYARLFLLRRNRDGKASLHMEAPWSPAISIDLPSQAVIHNPLSVSPTSSPERRREYGLKRTVKFHAEDLLNIARAGPIDCVDLTDRLNRRHRVQLRLRPSSALVQTILATCNLVLPPGSGSGMLTCWWEVMRWLRGRPNEESSEFMGIVVVLFCLAVPFIDEKHSRNPPSQRRKKTGLLRSSSGTAIDMSGWETMLEHESRMGNGNVDFMASSGWSWLGEQMSKTAIQLLPTSSVRVFTGSPTRSSTKLKTQTFLIHCAGLAREFLQTPFGEAAIGTEGYLPVAVSKNPEERRTALGMIVVALQLVSEERKLDIRLMPASNSDSRSLAPILAQLGCWLGWKAWTWRPGSYFHAEIADADTWLFEDSHISGLEVPLQPFEPRSIFTYIEDCVQRLRSPQFQALPDVLGISGRSARSRRDFHQAKDLTPRTLAICDYVSRLHQAISPLEKATLMMECGLTAEVLETLPDGISVMLQETLVRCQANPPTTLDRTLLDFIDRSDLLRQAETNNVPSSSSKAHLAGHEAHRDYHGIGNIASETDSFHTWDTSLEADRQSVTRLIFRDDRRYQEASKLVNQLRPPVAECSPEPEWTESDFLEAQKDLVQHVTRRTLAVSLGRGMMNFSARMPLLTEKVVVPAFTLQCVMKAKTTDGAGLSTVTLSAEKAAFTEDKVCWAFFHNGASTGLMISKQAKGIDTSWILYNKPVELTNRHAGFLLALGLNGHLKSLAKWVAFKYLTPKHTMTSIGLLLGLSASFLGTMDTLVTRLLSVHVARLLPPGAAELNLSPLTQTAGIMGIGLLYCSSQHRRMSEVMLSEVENMDLEEGVSEEVILRDEGYRLAAGFALGLINMGHGKRLHALHDLNPVERLLSVAIGTKNIDFVHVLDRATAGAIIALTLIFMKTDDEAVSRKIDIPDTTHQFDYVRPDMFLLRTVARHLIMWSKICPTKAFIKISLPKAYRSRFSLRSTKCLSTDDMPFFNIIAGICLSLGLRFAGSASLPVRDLLIGYLDQFIRLTRLPAMNYDAVLARNSVRNCQDVVALAAAAVMAGTGDLPLMRRLRSLHGRVDADTPYGSHLAAHMALGTLFLGGGTYTLGNSNLAVASLLCAFYPLFPTSVLDNRCHLQAFRHLWVLATEARCLVPRVFESLRPISSPVSIVLKNGVEMNCTAPCLLPPLSEIAMIRSVAPEYWNVTLDWTSRPPPISLEHWSLLLRRRSTYDAPPSSAFTSALQALSESDPTPSASATPLTPYRHGQSSNPLEWLFGLDSLRHLDAAEVALVLPPAGQGFGGTLNRRRFWLGTVVDTRLELERSISKSGGEMSCDALWQLRLLFAWYDRSDGETEQPQGDSKPVTEATPTDNPSWLKREVVDALRWKVWKMAGGSADEVTKKT